MLAHGTIKKEIKEAFVSVMNDEGDRTEALDQVADKIATAVVNAIKSATIVYTAGLVSPAGAVTGTFQGSLK